MISKQLVDEVYKEAAKLREFAEPEEISNLDFKTLSPLSPSRCIYGQMTGNCWSRRATELIGRCAAILTPREPGHTNACALPMRSSNTAIDLRRDGEKYYSPIEVYIPHIGADNRALIDYLKGKTYTLDLSHTINC